MIADGEQIATKNEHGCGPYSGHPYMCATVHWKLTCLAAFFKDAKVGGALDGPGVGLEGAVVCSRSA